MKFSVKRVVDGLCFYAFGVAKNGHSVFAVLEVEIAIFLVVCGKF